MVCSAVSLGNPIDWFAQAPGEKSGLKSYIFCPPRRRIKGLAGQIEEAVLTNERWQGFCGRPLTSPDLFAQFLEEVTIVDPSYLPGCSRSYVVQHALLGQLGEYTEDR